MAGELIKLPYQYEYNDFLLGSSTEYLVESWDGLFGMPDLRTSDLTPLDRPGVIPGQDLLGARSMVAKISMLVESGQADVEAARVAFTTAFRSTDIEKPLVYSRPGQPKRFVNCRPRKLAVATDYALAHGLGNISLMMYASDPMHYDLDATVLTTAILQDASSGQFGTVVNGGNQPAHWVLTGNGPCTGVHLTLGSQTPFEGRDQSGLGVSLSVSLTASDTLVVDSATRSITKNGVSVYGSRNADNRWWMLNPGDNTVLVSRDVSSGIARSDWTLTFHNTWAL